MNSFFFIKIRRVLLILFLLVTSVGCDQATKILARDYLTISGPLTYFQGAVRFELAENPGAFLSLGAELPKNLRFLIFTISVAVFLGISLLFLIRKKTSLINTVSLSLIIGGGLGNLFDRFFRESVTDFVIMKMGPLKTGIFNIADVLIVIGVLLMILDSIWVSKQNPIKNPHFE